MVRKVRFKRFSRGSSDAWNQILLNKTKNFCSGKISISNCVNRLGVRAMMHLLDSVRLAVRIRYRRRRLVAVVWFDVGGIVLQIASNETHSTDTELGCYFLERCCNVSGVLWFTHSHTNTKYLSFWADVVTAHRTGREKTASYRITSQIMRLRFNARRDTLVATTGMVFVFFISYRGTYVVDDRHR